ncbi:MAG: zinc metalloprotease [Planctomycetes bacterium]|nr:zinc metalloprotease [Planctomycetota bacterium]
MAPPKIRACGTMIIHNRNLEADPSYRERLHQYEHDVNARMAAGFKVAKKKGPMKIQVVVHVVYKNPDEKLSAAQVKSQIKALNRDYRAANADKSDAPPVWTGLVADAGIEFVLATKDPKGKKTTGITYTKTTRDEFGDDDSVKDPAQGGVKPWNSAKYLNLWSCNLGGGLLGYAQFPGGPATTDGVVILYTAFGTTGVAAVPFNLGRTATHEVGHWLNLRHIWGDTPDCSGGDGVSDTPNAATPNFNKPNFPHITCNNGPSGDMFMNYMDYVDDDTMIMFTPQQVVRMHSALAGPRASVVI